MSQKTRKTLNQKTRRGLMRDLATPAAKAIAVKGGQTAGGANMLMADGSVHFLSYSVSTSTW